MLSWDLRGARASAALQASSQPEPVKHLREQQDLCGVDTTDYRSLHFSRKAGKDLVHAATQK